MSGSTGIAKVFRKLLLSFIIRWMVSVNLTDANTLKYIGKVNVEVNPRLNSKRKYWKRRNSSPN